MTEDGIQDWAARDPISFITTTVCCTHYPLDSSYKSQFGPRLGVWGRSKGPILVSCSGIEGHPALVPLRSCHVQQFDL